MKVKEMIKKLSKFSGNCEVIVYEQNNVYSFPVENIYIDDDGNVTITGSN